MSKYKAYISNYQIFILFLLNFFVKNFSPLSTQYTFKGEDINQFGVHTGISFPLGFDNSIDVGLMYGIRGTTNQNLLKENIFQATFSVNFGELWFVRQDR